MATFKRFLVLAILLFLYSGTQLLAQVDTEFWFVGPDVTYAHQGAYNKNALRITAGAEEAKVTVYLLGGTVSKSITIPPYTQYSFQTGLATTDPNYWNQFTMNNLENIGLNSKNQKGIHIVSDNGKDITAYYEVANEYNPDIFTLKGDNALGKDFYVPSQIDYPNKLDPYPDKTPEPYEQIHFVATEAGTTEIIITPTSTTFAGGSNTGVANVPFKVYLNQGETYSISSNKQAATASLGGTHITSDKKIAVTVSDDSVEPVSGSGYDLIGDQIVPVSIIGKEYIAIKCTNNNNDQHKLYVTATEDNTVVWKDGVKINTINSGQTISIDFKGTSATTSAYINTSKPVYAYQLSGTGNEIGSALLPTIAGCTGSRRVSFKRSFNSLFMVQLATQNINRPNIVMYDHTGTQVYAANFSNTAIVKWSYIAGTGKNKLSTDDDAWYIASVDMGAWGLGTTDPYAIAINPLVPNGLFHLSVFNQNGSSLDYGYFSAYNPVKISPVSQQCVGTSVLLTAENPTGNYTWKMKDDPSFSATGNSLEVKKGGEYYLSRTEYGCTAADTFDVVFKSPSIKLNVLKNPCPNTPVVFTAEPTITGSAYTYIWRVNGSIVSNGAATNNVFTVSSINPGDSAIVSVEAAEAGCSSTVKETVIAKSTPQVNFKNIGTSMCVNDTIRPDQSFSTYLWTLPNGSTSTAEFLVATLSGTYTLTGTFDGCSSTGTTTIQVNPLPVVQINDQTLCYGTQATYSALAATTTTATPITQQWVSETSTITTPTYTIDATTVPYGKVWLKVKDAKGCSAIDEATVTWNTKTDVALNYTSASQATSIDANTIIQTCTENPVTLTAAATTSSGVKSYSWSIAGVVQANTTNTITVPVASGTSKEVIINITDNNNCTATDKVTITAYATPAINVSKASICLNETFTASVVAPNKIATYNWYNSSASLIHTGIDYIPTFVGSYSITGISDNGCISNTLPLTVSSLPTASITGSPACPNTDFIFDGSGSTGVSTYAWNQTGVPFDGTKSYTASSFHVKLPGTVSLEVTNTAGCKAKTTADPSWKTLHTVDISYNSSTGPSSVSPAKFCPNAPVTLTGTVLPADGATVTYSWKIGGVEVNNTSTYSFNAPAANGSTTVTLDVKYNGCDATKNIVITAFPDPNTLLTPQEVCLHNTLELSKSVDPSKITNFTWSFGGIIQTADVFNNITPSVGGNYLLSIEDLYGCAGSVVNKVNDPTIVIATPDKVAACNGTSHLFAIDTPNPTYTYTWETALGATFTGSTFNAVDSGTYKVSAVYNNALACWDSTSVQLKWPNKKMLDVGAKLPLCSTGFPFNIIGKDVTAGFTNYTWQRATVAGGPLGPIETPGSTYNLATALPAGIYAFRVEADYTFPDFPGTTCHIFQVFNLEVLAVMPALNYNQSLVCVPNSATVCLCDGESVQFSTSTSVAYTSYTWTFTTDTINIPPTPYPGPPNASIVANKTGTYYLEALQTNGCIAKGKVNVDVTPMPKNNLTSTIECEGKSIVITNSADPAPNSYDYKWVYNNIDIKNNNYTFKTPKAGFYNVTATSKGANNRCKTTDDITIKYPTKPSVTLKDNAICSSTTFNLIPEFTGIAPQTTPASIIINTPTWTYGATHVPIPDPTKVKTTGIYNLDLIVTTDLGNDCPYSYPLALNVVQEPQFNIPDQAICDGLSTTLTATVTSGSYSSLLWQYTGTTPNGAAVKPAKPYSLTQDFPATSTITVEEDGYYNVTGSVSGIRPPNTPFTCNSISAPIQLTVNPNPVVTVLPSPDALNFYVCKGGYSDVMATSSTVTPTNYTWSNGVTGINQITVDKGGYYEATGTDSNGCIDKDGVEMISYVKTPVKLPVFQPICANTSVTLPIIPGVVAFQWYFDHVGNTITGGPNQPMTANVTGTYWLRYQNENRGCEVDTFLFLTVLPMPVIKVTAPTKQFCSGESYLLDPGISGNYSYQWSRAPLSGGASQIVSNNRTYEAKVSGNYTLIATENGCSSTSTTQVVVNPIPTVILGPDFNYCKDVTFTLSVKNPAGLSGYIWSTGAADNGKASITAAKDGIYTVTAFSTNSDGSHCSNDTSIVATSYPTLSLSKLSSLETVCDNSTITLTSPLIVPTEISSYQWFYNSLTSGVQGNLNTPWTRSGTEGGNYIYQVKDLNGCFTSQLMPVEVLPAPKVELPTIGCFADTLVVEPQDSYVSYMWNNNASDNKNFKVVDVLGSSIYTVEVLDRNNCVTNASTTFDAKPIPNPSLGNDINVCAGTLLWIKPTNTSGTPYTSYLWSTKETTDSIYVEKGSYGVTVIDANGCKNTTAPFKINWLPLPSPYLGLDTTICPMFTVILDAGRDSVNNAYKSYDWIVTGTTTQTDTAIISIPNEVFVTDNKGCVGYDSRIVTHMVSPVYNIPSDTLCDNITHVLDGTDGGLYTFVRWRYNTTDTITPTLEVNNPGGTYYVNADDGCFAVADTVTIGFWETPVITSIDTMIYARLTIYADSGLQPYKYTLNQGNLQESNVFYLQGNGTNEVYVQDQNGCWAKDTVEINSVLDIDIPKFFTPNEDGYNDKWKIEGLQERFPDAMLSIYDRYGRFLVKFRGDADGWDGTYLNQPMPSDDYWFYLDLVQINKTIKGNLTLKR